MLLLPQKELASVTAGERMIRNKALRSYFHLFIFIGPLVWLDQKSPGKKVKLIGVTSFTTKNKGDVSLEFSLDSKSHSKT